ncbi:MAG: monovalent cation/H+ antiporter subunit D family protein [Candidatus Schekmanbacteria bacterium]|nr:monovalent cation/H+ antiporter subunit D family protein [Candidatus Schekmanbacteria bacterium]
MKLAIILLLPIICTVLINVAGERSRGLRNFFCLFAAIVDFILVCTYISPALLGQEIIYRFVETSSFSMVFRVEIVSVYLALSMTFLWILTVIYSFGYMEHEPHAQTRYYASLIINITAAMGIAFSANLITFFVFFEMLTIAVYPLVVHEETKEAYDAGILYGAYLLSGGAAVLFATVLIYLKTGTVNFTTGGIPGLAAQSQGFLILLFVLLTFGFGFKAALIPLHYWLPEAMVAPTPISAVLHAVAVVNVGLFGFTRVIFNVFGPDLYHKMGFDNVIMFMAALTVLGGAILGLRQTELKKMLAMSTVNQLSYVLLGLVSFQATGMMGGILHVYFHAFMKITLFYCAGAIITQSGNKYIAKMGGLARHMPITMTCFAIAAVGIIGLPPVCGWVSKWYLMQGYLTMKKPLMAALFLVSGIIELGYFFPPIFKAFFRKEEEGAFHFHHDTSRLGSEAPAAMWVPIIIVTIASVAFGLGGFVPHWLGKPALAGLLGYVP